MASFGSAVTVDTMKINEVMKETWPTTRLNKTMVDPLV